MAKKSLENGYFVVLITDRPKDYKNKGLFVDKEAPTHDVILNQMKYLVKDERNKELFFLFRGAWN